MRRLLLLLALGLLACGSAPAQTQAHRAHRLEAGSFSPHARLDGLRVSFRTLSPDTVSHGAPLVTLTVANELPVARTLEVSVDCDCHGSAERRISLGPSASVSADFVIPTVAMTYGTPRVLVREVGSADGFCRVGNVPARVYDGYDRGTLVNVLVGSSVDGIATAADYSHEDERNAAGRARAGDVFAFSSQAMGEAGWSADARAYSPYQLVMLSAAEWEAVPPGARRAIVGHVVSGGVLILCGATGLPEEARGFPRMAFGGTWLPDRSEAVGSGLVVLAPAVGEGRRPPLSRKVLRDLAAAADRRLADSFAERDSLQAIARNLPPLDVPGLPVSLFLALLAVFALGVVPAVLVLCIRRRRRLAALVALPLVSVAIGLVVVVSVLAVYGVTPRLAQASLVVLNSADRRAMVCSRACLFSPVDVTDRLRFARDALVRVVGTRPRGRRADLDFTTELRLALGESVSAAGRGWMQTLLPVAYATTEMRDTNARLVAEELADGRLKVTNLLGGRVSRLAVLDGRGRVFVGTDLPDGATRELEEERGAAAGSANGGAFARPGDSALARGYASSMLEPTSYRADMEECPFLADTLGGTSAERRERTTVFGRYGREAGE